MCSKGGAEVQRCRAEVVRCRSCADVQRCRGYGAAEVQWFRGGAEVQNCRDAAEVVLRCRGGAEVLR